jgi:hypothetical protein
LSKREQFLSKRERKINLAGKVRLPYGFSLRKVLGADELLGGGALPPLPPFLFLWAIRKP